MSYLRYVLAPVVVCLALLLTGALSLHPARAVSAPAPQSESTALEDPAAAKVLQQAVDALNPARISWVQATIWQQMAAGDLRYRAEGSYQSGPNHRFRLQLNVVVGRSAGEMQVVSDGVTLWQSTHVAGDKPAIIRAGLSDVMQPFNGPLACSEARAELFRNNGFTGIHALVDELRRRMTVNRAETVSWKGRVVTRLTLTWNPASLAVLAPPGQPWPAHLPSQCVLYLDNLTFWPHRLEWWAPTKNGTRLCMQMELRNPILNRPLAKEQCDQVFSFDPGPEDVPDLAGSSQTMVEARSRKPMESWRAAVK
jgi:hypothetical protein